MSDGPYREPAPRPPVRNLGAWARLRRLLHPPRWYDRFLQGEIVDARAARLGADALALAFARAGYKQAEDAGSESAGNGVAPPRFHVCFRRAKIISRVDIIMNRRSRVHVWQLDDTTLRYECVMTTNPWWVLAAGPLLALVVGVTGRHRLSGNPLLIFFLFGAFVTVSAVVLSLIDMRSSVEGALRDALDTCTRSDAPTAEVEANADASEPDVEEHSEQFRSK